MITQIHRAGLSTDMESALTVVVLAVSRLSVIRTGSEENRNNCLNKNKTFTLQMLVKANLSERKLAETGHLLSLFRF